MKPSAQTSMPFLHRRFTTRYPRKCGPLNVTALADVTLLILLFVIMQSWVVLKPGISLELPEAPFEGGAPLDSMVLILSQEGLILFNDERTTLDALPTLFARALRAGPGATLVLEADRRIAHGTVTRIYALAQNAGFSQVILATRAVDPAAGGLR
jgi:biopolymer transport protein ExbD